MAGLNLSFLGSPQIEHDDKLLEISASKALALLAYLALTQQNHSRDALGTLLWPDSDQSQARTYLRHALWSLKKEVGERWLYSSREQIGFQADDDVWLDVAAFRAGITAVSPHNHPPGQMCPDCLEQLQTAVALYRDNFLTGFTLPDAPAFDEWQFFQAEELRQLLASALEQLVEEHTARQEYNTAVTYARRWLSLDTLQEPVHRTLMGLYALAGQQAAALRQYQECVRLLEGELGMTPEAETSALYEAIRTRQLGSPEVTELARPATVSTSPTDRYQIEDLLDTGAHGEVYRGHDVQTGTPVIIKRLRPDVVRKDKKLVDRFMQEAEALSQLNHPNIVSLLATFERDGQQHLVMEYVAAGSLAQRLRQPPQMPLAEVLDIALELADALSRAHHLNIIHRDVKPENVLVTADGAPRLTDFGVARLIKEDSRLTETRTLLGSPAYMSPELLQRAKPDVRSDIWSFGVLLFEMLAGQRPFPGEQITAALISILNDPLPDIRQFRPDLPEALADLLQRMLVKEPENRPASMRLVAAELEAIRAGQPVPSLDHQAVFSRAVEAESKGHYTAAIDLLSPLLLHNAANEVVHRDLMRLFALNGRRHEALRQYQICLSALAARGAQPQPETETLYQQIMLGNVNPPPATAPKPIWLPPTPIVEEMERTIPLVGRKQELVTLQDQMRVVWQGKGKTILLAGEAGVGKTRLAYELLRSAAMFHMTSLLGAAYEQEENLPYQPFIEAFDRYLAEQGRSQEENPITHFKPIGSSEMQQEHTALFKTTADFLITLASRGPIVLLLDDLHAADEASLGLFHYLARHTRTQPIILLATYRTDVTSSPTSPFGRLLNALYREQLSEVMELARLRQPDSAAIITHILGGDADPALIDSILEITEGNPFFTQEISRALLKTESLFKKEDRWQLRLDGVPPVPSQLRDLLRERVQRLGPTVEPVLTAAAVIGREFRFPLLRSVAAMADHELLDALDAALDGYLLEETEEGYRFRHSLIRHTLYDALSRARRRWLHTRVAEVIEALSNGRTGSLLPHVEVLAFHYNQSDYRERTLPYLLQAGQKAMDIYALEIARDHFEQALVLMDDLHVGEPAQQWQALELLGRCTYILADIKRAVACFEEALAIPSTKTWQPDPDSRLQLRLLAAFALTTVGDMNAADQHLEDALTERGEVEEESSEYAYLWYNVAMRAWHRHEYQKAFAAAQRSLEIASHVNDPEAIARGYEMLALTAHSLGDWRQGLSFETERTLLMAQRMDVTWTFDAHL